MHRLQMAAVAVLLAYERIHETVDDRELATAMRNLEYALPPEMRKALEATLEQQWATPSQAG